MARTVYLLIMYTMLVLTLLLFHKHPAPTWPSINSNIICCSFVHYTLIIRIFKNNQRITNQLSSNKPLSWYLSGNNFFLYSLHHTKIISC